ncbi:hypothetical protein IC617_01815 [Neiella sp. HB171785]|uniref:Uncharacterized protein n=1 Tax=Neiella litorisoli TaxID=2771431 RepID=A0A8J6UES6_9GAMM|nr:hypothetical protein [Neiella litorisoli]MBD1388156.1 hypothetical protein [Neiella litorisoli]
MNKSLFISYTLALMALILPFSSHSASANYSVLSCETCNYDFQFETIAKSKVNGKVVVVNPRTAVMKAYFLLDEPGYGDWGVIATPIGLPSEMQEIKNLYISLKNAFEGHRSGLVDAKLNGVTDELRVYNYSTPLQTLSSASTNGCGAEGGQWNELIPDFPFVSACNSHDLC